MSHILAAEELSTFLLTVSERVQVCALLLTLEAAAFGTQSLHLDSVAAGIPFLF